MAIATTTAVDLANIAQGENQKSQKSGTRTTLFASTDSAPTLATTFAKVSSRFDLGNNTGGCFNLAWTKGSGTILTLAFKTSADDGSSDPYEYEPEYGTATSGVRVADIAQVTYATATWIYSGSPSASIAYLRFRPVAPNLRFVELWAKSDNASGSIDGFVMAGSRS